MSIVKPVTLPARIDEAGELELESPLPAEFRKGYIATVVLVPEDDESESLSAWRDLATKAFFDGYADSDAIYDDMR